MSYRLAMMFRMYLRHIVLIVVFFDYIFGTGDKFYDVLIGVFTIFSYYFEICGNCSHIVWIRTGSNFLTTMALGPFWLPSECPKCGSADYIHNIGEA